MTYADRLSHVISAIGDPANTLTPDENTCLAVIVRLTADRGAVLISKFRQALPKKVTPSRAQIAMEGLIRKGIIEQEQLPEDISHMGGGSGFGIKSEFKP